MTWDGFDEDAFWSDDPLERANAKAAVMGRPGFGSGVYKAAWELAEEAREEAAKRRIRLIHGWHLIWWRGRGVVSLFGPRPYSIAFVVVRRHPVFLADTKLDGRLTFPRLRDRRRRRR